MPRSGDVTLGVDLNIGTASVRQWLPDNIRLAKKILLENAQRKGFSGTEADFIESRTDDLITIEVSFECETP